LGFLFPGIKGYQLRRNVKSLRASLVFGIIVALAFGTVLFLLNRP
jgi:hypothetical protein